MATIDIARKFAEHAMKAEHVLGESGITGNVGRVMFVLAMAQKDWGVSQKDVVDAMGLPKDVVSKLVGFLVQAGLLVQERDSANSRIKRLATTYSGSALLSRVQSALQPPRPTKQEPEQQCTRISIFD
jgi:DNA-binding MarR family transcriptional regulator